MKIDKIVKKLNEDYRRVVKEKLVAKFGDCKFETEWNIFSMALQTTWDKKLPRKKKQEIKNFIEGYSDGFAEAMNLVGSYRRADGENKS